MKNVTVQSDGHLGFLGKVTAFSDARRLVNGTDPAGGFFGPDVANVNSSPQAVENTGLLGTTRIQTPTGAVAIEDLQPGDTVMDAGGTAATIRHILKTPVSRTAICLRAPYFGLDQDLVVGADHRIAVTSDTAEYLFGSETVLVPVWALKDGREAQHWELSPKTQMYQIQLDQVAALKIGKCAVESMPKSGASVGKVLSKEEARCFASEHKSGYQN